MSARPPLRLAGLALATIFAGCAPRAATPAPPPGPLTAQIHQQALAQASSPGAPAPEVVILPQSFSDSVQAYDDAVRSVVTSAPATIEDSRGPIALLAMAIERTPNASELDGAGAAALMRANLEALASPRARGDVRPALHALGIATDFFLVLARGPYAAFPEVRRNADELAQAIHDVPSSRPATAADLGPPLRAAGAVLDSVRLAAGSPTTEGSPTAEEQP